MAPPNPAARVRPAILSDVPQIHNMIHDLATFEHAAHKVRATPASLSATLTFAPSPENLHPEQRVAKALLITVPSAADPKGEDVEKGGGDDGAGVETVAGMAIYFHNYSTWTSLPGVYLEDLFIYPAYRRRGLATLLLAELGKQAERLAAGVGPERTAEGARLEWSCLKWNENALRFYRGIGGITGDEWVKVRCDGEGLRTLRMAEEKVRADGGSS